MKSQLLAATAASVASLTIGLAGSASGAGTQPGAAPPAPDKTFHMVRSSTALAAHCLGRADAIVKITKLANAERMVIQASGLPRNTDFDVFINQVPNAPFGMSWYPQPAVPVRAAQFHRRSFWRDNRASPMIICFGSIVRAQLSKQWG